MATIVKICHLRSIKINSPHATPRPAPCPHRLACREVSVLFALRGHERRTLSRGGRRKPSQGCHPAGGLSDLRPVAPRSCSSSPECESSCGAPHRSSRRRSVTTRRLARARLLAHRARRGARVPMAFFCRFRPSRSGAPTGSRRRPSYRRILLGCSWWTATRYFHEIRADAARRAENEPASSQRKRSRAEQLAQARLRRR